MFKIILGRKSKTGKLEISFKCLNCGIIIRYSAWSDLTYNCPEICKCCSKVLPNVTLLIISNKYKLKLHRSSYGSKID